MILYHGTNEHFEEFDPDKLSGKDSIDQYGSGFYFYTDMARTSRHGDIIVVAKIATAKRVVKFSKINLYRLSRNQIEYLIGKSPVMESALENFVDLSTCTIDEAIKIAAKNYMGHNQDILHQMNCIGNDFFPYGNIKILLENVCKLTGYIGINVDKEGIYVIWKKSAIQIINHTIL